MAIQVGSTPAFAQPKSLEITLGGHAGESYRTLEVRESTFLIDGPVEPGHSKSGGDYTLTDVANTTDDIRPNGDLVKSSRNARLVRRFYLNDQLKIVFDSAKRQDRDFAAQSAEGRGLIERADTVTVREWDPHARLIEDRSVAPDGRPIEAQRLADSAELSDGNIRLPETPVAEGQSWSAGERSLGVPTVGTLRFELLATLEKVETRGDETRALIRVEARNARFDAVLPGAMIDVKALSGRLEYSARDQRMLFIEVHGQMQDKAPEPDGRVYGMTVDSQFSVATPGVERWFVAWSPSLFAQLPDPPPPLEPSS